MNERVTGRHLEKKRGEGQSPESIQNQDQNPKAEKGQGHERDLGDGRNREIVQSVDDLVLRLELILKKS